MHQKTPKWVDPREPVSVTHIGKYTVTIYDQDAYNASLLQYPDDDNATQSKRNATKPVTHVAFQKKKPASRYNWITKLDTPLAITIRQKEKAS